MGIVHHSQYVRYFEIARIEMLRSFGISYRDMEEQGALLVVVSLAARYRSPARFDDILEVTTTVIRLTGIRIQLEYRIHRQQDRVLVAEGETTLACVDRAGQLQVMPRSVRDLLGSTSGAARPPAEEG